MATDGLAGRLSFSDASEMPPDEFPEPIPGEDPPAGGRSRGRTGARTRTTRPPKAAAPARRDASSAAGPSTRAVTDELLGYVELLALLSVPWCAECAEVVHQDAKPIAQALARLAVRSPRVLKMLRETVLMADAANLLRALRRPLTQIHAHHIRRELLPDGGMNGNGSSATADHVTHRYAPYPGPGSLG